jgi:predicted RND superfamily exporter protein
MLQNLYLIGVRYRLIVLLSVIAITVFFIAGIPRLEIDAGLDSLIAANDPDKLVYQRALVEFGTDDKIYIFIEDANLWSPEKLIDIEKIHYEINRLDGIDNVASLFSLRSLQSIDGSLESGPVIDHAMESQAEVDTLRDYLLQNKLFVDDYFADHGQVMAFVVSMDNVRTEGFEIERLHNDIETILIKFRGNFQSLFQVGDPRIYTELKNQLAGDFLFLGSVSAIIVLITIIIFVRSLLAAVIPMITSLIAIIWTFGLQGWFGMPIGVLSTMLPSLIIIIAATANIHIVLGYIRCLGKEPEASHEEIMRKVAKRTGISFLLTVLIIFMGLASNMMSSIGLIQDFAIASTFAILVNGIITVLFVPGLLTGYRRASKDFIENRNETDKFPGKLISFFRQSSNHCPRMILFITGLLSIFFFYHASTFYVTNDPASYFSENQSLMQDYNRLHDELAGANTFFITLESNSEKAFLEPRNIEKLAQIQDFVRGQEVFDQSRSLADFLKHVHLEIAGEQPGMALPRTRQLVAQYLILFHRSELQSYVSQDYSRANIIVRHNINDSQILNQHISELEGVVSQIAGAELVSSVVGKNLMVNQAAESLKKAQINAFVILVILIFIVVSVLFTSYKGGLIAIVPAIVPVAIMFGVMSLLNIPLNPGTAMVAVIAVALAVDGTVQLLTRYIEHCRRSSDYIGAVNLAVNEVGPSLIIFGVALSLGFGILVFSKFTVVAQFGALITATILLSILTNLIITPILMSKIRLVGLYQILSMSVDEETIGSCTLFRNMTEYQRRKAILISELHEFQAGDLLIEQDTVGRSMYLILTGEAEVARRDNGQSHALATLGAGQIFGEIGYIREIERTADVRAITNITALIFDYERLQKDLKYFPNIVAKLNFNISYILGKRLADMVEQSKS